MPVLGGSLSYKKDTNSFYVNEVGQNEGWVPMPISINPEDLTSQSTNALLEKFGGSNQSRIYVDSTNPSASDVKGNAGNSALRPFRTLQRALLEVARRSFKKGTGNDLYERTSIIIAPGEYEIYNGPAAKLNDFDKFGRYQDASNLIQRNTDWVVARAYATIAAGDAKTPEYKQYLVYVVNALVNDLSQGQNTNTLALAKSFVVDPEAEAPSNPAVDLPAYFISDFADYSPVRVEILDALASILTDALAAMRNAGSYTDSSIVVDTENPTCQDVAATITSLVAILTDTLDCSVNPHSLLPEARKASIQSFPEDYEPPAAFYQKFNTELSAGVILPRGVSILGEDLRKVVFRPNYVPPKDGSEGRGSIFKMTGANFFSGFTVKDNPSIAESHHQLSVFEFCENAAPNFELDSYYDKVNMAFSDYNIYYRALDSANLLEKNLEWITTRAVPQDSDQVKVNVFSGELTSFISAVIRDLRLLGNTNVVEFAKRFRSSHIDTITNVDPTEQTNLRAAAIALYKQFFTNNALPYLQLAYLNEANVAEGGYQDNRIVLDVTGTSATYDGQPIFGRCADITSVIYTYRDIIDDILDNGSNYTEYAQTLPVGSFSAGEVQARVEETDIVTDLGDDPDSVLGASPYIFSASLRSEYGMCGIDGDGSKVGGLKSYLAAQFTVISLQKDPDAFFNDATSTKEIGSKRYKGSDVSDTENYTNFGYRVTNGAYAQLVSCFCIGPARHYVAEEGGEFSITNSTSNFGDVSLYARGFNDYVPNRPELGSGAYEQDQGHKLIGVIRPKNIDFDSTTEIQSYGIGSVLSYQYTTTVLTNEPDPSAHTGWQDPPADWLDWTNTYLNTYGDTYYRAEMSTEPITVEVSREYVQGTNPETGQVLTRNVDYPTEFNNIKAVKLRLNGRLSNLPSSIRIKEDGTPDLKYIYAPEVVTINSALNSGPLDVSSISGENLYETEGNYKLYKLGESTTTQSLTVENKYLVSNWVGVSSELLVGTVNNYNSSIFTKRRAPVLSVKFVDDGEGGIYTDIVVDVSEGAGTVGEWFERSTVYSPTSRGDYSTLRTTLIGNSIFVKRFIDRRTTEEKKYRLVFKKSDSAKRIPPDNYIIRKGGETLSTQPFKLGANTEVLNTLYYTVNPQLITDNFLLELAGGEDGSGAYKTVANLEDNHDPAEADFFFMTELYSANSDDEYRAITSDDLSLTDRFYFTEDAEELSLLQSDSPTREYYANRPGYYTGMESSAPADFNNSQYQSAIQLFDRIGGNSVINLLFGVDNISSDLKSNLEVRSDGTTERVYLFGGLTAGLTVEFCKPSTIRASGQTWEYCGYYNYSTGVPALQTENLADRVDPGRKRQFRFEKIQKSIAGGRIYSTGMDELGNVIQGNTIIDLKSGEAETLVLGTTQGVLNLNTDSESNPEKTIAQNFNNISTNNITVNSSLKTTESAEIDFSKVSSANFKLPGQTNSSDAVITIGQPNLPSVRFITNQLDLQLAKNIKSRTFEQTELPDNKYVLQLGIGDSEVEINADNLDNLGSSPPSQEALENQYTLAKKTKDNDVALEVSNSTYVTPAQLKSWRISKGIVTTKGQTSLEAYVGLGWIDPSADYYSGTTGKPAGDGPVVTAAVLSSLNQWSLSEEEGGLGYQCSNPKAPNFRPLRDLYELALYIIDQGYTQEDTLTVYLKPGIYALRSIIGFNCGVKFIGEHMCGRFDGRDHLDILDDTNNLVNVRQSIMPTIYKNVSRNNNNQPIWDETNKCYVNNYGNYVSGLRSTIFVFDLDRIGESESTTSTRFTTDGYAATYVYPVTFSGKTNVFKNIIFWGQYTWYKMSTERVWVDKLMHGNNNNPTSLTETSDPNLWNTDNLAYDYQYDIENNLLDTIDVTAPDQTVYKDINQNNRFSAKYRVKDYYNEGGTHPFNSNCMGYNHPNLFFDVIPSHNNRIITALVRAHILALGSWSVRNQPYRSTTHVGRFGNDHNIDFYLDIDDPSNDFNRGAIYIDTSALFPELSLLDCIIGPVSRTKPFIGVSGITQGLKINLFSNHIRGNVQNTRSKEFDIKGLVRGGITRDGTTPSSSDHYLIPVIGSAPEKVTDEYGIVNETVQYYQFHSYSLIFLQEGASLSTLITDNPSGTIGSSALALESYLRTSSTESQPRIPSDQSGLSFERSTDGNLSYDILALNNITQLSTDLIKRIIWGFSNSTTPQFSDLTLRNFRKPDESLQYSHNRESFSVYINPENLLDETREVYRGFYGGMVANHMLGLSQSDNWTELGPIFASTNLFTFQNNTGLALSSYVRFNPRWSGGLYTNAQSNVDNNLKGYFAEVMSNTTNGVLNSVTSRVRINKLYQVLPQSGTILNGTVSITTVEGVTYLVGTNTSFSTQLNAGNLIVIERPGSTPLTAQIASISDNTTATLEGSPANLNNCRYGIQISPALDLSGVGGPTAPNGFELFIATHDQTLDLSGSTQLELIGGTPIIYKYYEDSGLTLADIGTEIGQFMPVAFRPEPGYVGAMGNTCRNIGFMHKVVQNFKITGPELGIYSSGNLYAIPHYPILVGSYDTTINKIFTYANREVLEEYNAHTLMISSITSVGGSYLKHILTSLLLANFRTNIYYSGLWGTSSYGDNFATNRTNILTSSYLPTWVINLDNPYSADISAPWGILINPETYISTGQSRNTFITNSSAYIHSLNDDTRFLNYTLSERYSYTSYYL